MTADLKLLGVCGLYCGACYHNRAAFPEGKHLLEKAAREGHTPEEFSCRGCRSDKLYRHPGCAECEFRACAEKKNVLHCGLCNENPCDRLKAFRSDDRPHHSHILDNLEAIKIQGPGRWLAGQQLRWKCACGTSFSWYEEYCHACGTQLRSYGPDPKRQEPVSD